jgi:hypothetical protein
MKNYAVIVLLVLLTGCSIVGKGNTPMAPYKVLSLDTEKNIEVRVYENMILVSAPMGKNSEDGRKQAFMKLFGYISGENILIKKVEMTAPVLMSTEQDKGTKISMTAPVFMDTEDERESVMSFVLPEEFKLENAPKPTDPELQLNQLKNYKVAAITFSGLLSKNNIKKHKDILDNWIKTQGYKKTGSYKTAGYNPPYTIPFFRRNEVLIPIEIK